MIHFSYANYSRLQNEHGWADGVTIIVLGVLLVVSFLPGSFRRRELSGALAEIATCDIIWRFPRRRERIHA